MRNRIFQFMLWLSVIGLALWAGGTLYQMAVVVPMWSHNPPESVTAFFEETRYNETIWNFFGPPYMAARLLPLLAALVFGWHLRQHRKFVTFATVCMFLMLGFTLFYIYPINEVLFARAGAGLNAEEVRSMARQWVIADRIRFAVGILAFLATLRALSMPVPQS